jgi:hypothetical protein
MKHCIVGLLLLIAVTQVEFGRNIVNLYLLYVMLFLCIFFFQIMIVCAVQLKNYNFCIP